MYKFIPIFALCLALAKAGVVDPVYRCGGVGTPIQFRMSDCEGHCTLIPGTSYDAEYDFMPGFASQSLSLRVEIILGEPMTIIDTVLPNSSVEPGNAYTARFNLVPTDVLSGQDVEIMASLRHTSSQTLEICIRTDITIA